jgi:hypothetical protein
MKQFILIIIILFTFSCTKDRIFTNNPGTNPNDTIQIVAGILKINEFVAKGSTLTNELGITDDWIEIYNPNNQVITLQANAWYITDDAVGSKTKFQLPSFSIEPFGFKVIFCDGQNMVQTQIHTNFGLSSAGEHLGLFYKSGNDILEIDSKQYGPQTIDNQSEGRSPDGSPNWTTFSNPTPGSSNQ